MAAEEDDAELAEAIANVVAALRSIPPAQRAFHLAPIPAIVGVLAELAIEREAEGWITNLEGVVWRPPEPADDTLGGPDDALATAALEARKRAALTAARRASAARRRRGGPERTR
jgi:hypothetical protein